MLAHLPERIETVGLNSPQCPACGEALDEFPGTEDSEVLEIEVKAYRVKFPIPESHSPKYARASSTPRWRFRRFAPAHAAWRLR